MDAAAAAKDRVDRAITLLERRLQELKARAMAAQTQTFGDDDLFSPQPSSESDRARIRELELAGQDAAEVLGRAADAIREALKDQEAG
ncbi:MAG: hypothetical protein HZY74_01635 [Brevundimonas sp.]|nr:MAG: hypothetical protein HZY74_01635 [Brevundimonas sp.]